MGFADFLTQGSPGQNATSFSQSGTQLPAYLEDYTHGILSSAANLASQPYQPYPNARVAPLNSNLQRAVEIGRDHVENFRWQPRFDAAEVATNKAGATSPLAIGRPALDQSMAIDSRTGAQGDLATARQSFPGAFQDYMNPFTSQVTDEIGRLGQRNWQENILPGLNDQFTRAGQYGSLQNQRQAERTGRDVSADITGQQTMALERGYNTAGQLFNQDASRALATASTASGIDENYARRLAETGSTLGNLAATDAGLQLSTGQQLGALGEARQRAQRADLDELLQVGALEQAQQQGGLDLAYEDFQRQQQHPYEQLGFLSNLSRGTPYSSSQYQSSTAPSGYNPSVLAQLAGGAAGLAGLSKLFSRGGAVRFARGGEVDEGRQPGPRLPIAGYLRALATAGYVEPEPTAGYLQLARAA